MNRKAARILQVNQKDTNNKYGRPKKIYQQSSSTKSGNTIDHKSKLQPNIH